MAELISPVPGPGVAPVATSLVPVQFVETQKSIPIINTIETIPPTASILRNTQTRSVLGGPVITRSIDSGPLLQSVNSGMIFEPAPTPLIIPQPVQMGLPPIPMPPGQIITSPVATGLPILSSSLRLGGRGLQMMPGGIQGNVQSMQGIPLEGNIYGINNIQGVHSMQGLPPSPRVAQRMMMAPAMGGQQIF